MMFQVDTAFALELLALIGATALLLAAKRAEKFAGFAKLISFLGIVLSILGMVCTAYYALRYRSEGYFDKPYIFTVRHEGKGEMMECPMMQKMMEKKMGGEGGGPETQPEGHRSHH